MRRFLILAVCLNIAFGAVCGMHAHLERAVDGPSGAAVYSIHVEPEIGPSHEADHDDGGEIDISLLAQLVGSLAALAALWVLARLGGYLWIPSRQPAIRVRVSSPAVAQIQRLIYYLHPPSHAPPFPAH